MNFEKYQLINFSKNKNFFKVQINCLIFEKKITLNLIVVPQKNYGEININ